MPNILARKQNAFVLWRLGNPADQPVLVIGQLQLGNPIGIGNQKRFALHQASGFPDLWEVSASQCGLNDGEVYHYWFEVSACSPGRPSSRILITDPTATTVDWRLRGPRLAPPFTEEERFPPAVIKIHAGKIVPADPGGETVEIGSHPLEQLPVNNRLVIYELPTTWTRSGEIGCRDIGVGTFRDVTALIDANVEGANFDDIDITKMGRAYIKEIGINVY